MSYCSWDYIGHNFCEGYIGGYPEYFNSYTAILSITPIGLWGLFGSSLRNDVTRLIYIFLTLNGVGSFLRHYYGYNFYGQMDTATLHLAGWLINYFAFKTLILYLFSFWYKNEIKSKNYPKCLDLCLDFVLLVDIAFCVFFFLADAVSGKPWGIDINFSESFAICQIITVCLCICLAVIYRTEKMFVIYISVGMVYLLVAVIIWVSTEPNCSEGNISSVAFERYTHGWWHIFSIHSSHMIIQSIFYADLLALGKPVEFQTSDNLFMRCIYCVFPITRELEILP